MFTFSLKNCLNVYTLAPFQFLCNPHIALSYFPFPTIGFTPSCSINYFATTTHCYGSTEKTLP